MRVVYQTYIVPAYAGAPWDYESYFFCSADGLNNGYSDTFYWVFE